LAVVEHVFGLELPPSINTRSWRKAGPRRGGQGAGADGRHVAFVLPTNDDREVRIAGTDGSGERLLWRAGKDWKADGLQWFPDGQRIMVEVWQGKDRNRLVAISATDGAGTTLWEGKNDSDLPQLSPDGKSVLRTKRVRYAPRADELWLLRLDDRSSVLLFEGQSTIEGPRWTPDGAGIVFLSDRRLPGTTLDLWLLRTSGGKALGSPELIKTGLGEMFGGRPMAGVLGAITRDGAYYFHRGSQNGGMRQLLTTKLNPDTGKVVGASSFVSRIGGESWSPSFSRDGRWLAYLSGHRGSSPSLVIQSVETGEERVVPMKYSPSQLNWAVMFPDGRSVLVDVGTPDGELVVHRVDVATGAWTSLKKPDGPEVKGFVNGISPDGRTIFLNRNPPGAGEMHLIARDIETGQERELRSWKGGGRWALSDDGKQLAVAHFDGKDLVIDILPSAGGPNREVYRAPGIRSASITWTPDERYLIFGPSDEPATAKVLMRLSVEGGEAQPIGISASEDEQVRFPRGLGATRVHPNGRQLIYTASGDANGGENWVLENFLPKATK